jgi:UDP-glucose 4-epimerase
MSTVLVLGGSGFLGSHAVRCLVKSGYTVWSTHSPGKNPPSLPGTRWLAVDLSQSTFAEQLPPRCDHLIFLAQSRAWRRFPDAADDIYRVNIASLHLLLLYACRAGVRSVIVGSSGSVYSDQSKPARESDSIDFQASRSYYVATKLAAELLLGAYGQLFPVAQLRIFMPYGKGQNSEMLFPELVRRVAQGKPIILHGEDGLRANPVAATDVAETIMRCLSLRQSSTLNVAGPEVMTLRSIGSVIGKVLGREPLFDVQATATPLVLVGDLDLSRAKLGWAPATRLESGLREWLSDGAVAGAA